MAKTKAAPSIPDDLIGMPVTTKQWAALHAAGAKDIFTLISLLRDTDKIKSVKGIGKKTIADLKTWAFTAMPESTPAKAPSKNGKSKTSIIAPTSSSLKALARTGRELIQVTQELEDLYFAIEGCVDVDGSIKDDSYKLTLEQFEIKAADTFEGVVNLIKVAGAERDFWKEEKAMREKKRKAWDLLEKGLRIAARRYMIATSQNRIDCLSGATPILTKASDKVDKASFSFANVPEDLLDTDLFDWVEDGEQKNGDPFMGYVPQWKEITDYLIQHGNQPWCQLRAPETTRSLQIR